MGFSDCASELGVLIVIILVFVFIILIGQLHSVLKTTSGSNKESGSESESKKTDQTDISKSYPLPTKDNNFIEIHMDIQDESDKGPFYLVLDKEHIVCLKKGCKWKTSPLRYVLKKIGEKPEMNEFKRVDSYIFEIMRGEVLHFALPMTDDSLVMWNPDRSLANSGFFVRRTKQPNEFAQGSYTRAEFFYDNDSNMLYFNNSAVEGLTAQMDMSYKTKAGKWKTSCKSMASCPKKFKAKDGRCLAPKWDIVNEKPASEPRYGCAYPQNNQCNCREFWSTDDKAKEWSQLVNAGGDLSKARCQAYSWAFDEKLFVSYKNDSEIENICKDKHPDDEEAQRSCKTQPKWAFGCTIKDNPIMPLQAAKIEKGGVFTIKYYGLYKP